MSLLRICFAEIKIYFWNIRQITFDEKYAVFNKDKTGNKNVFLLDAIPYLKCLKNQISHSISHGSLRWIIFTYFFTISYRFMSRWWRYFMSIITNNPPSGRWRRFAIVSMFQVELQPKSFVYTMHTLYVYTAEWYRLHNFTKHIRILSSIILPGMFYSNNQSKHILLTSLDSYVSPQLVTKILIWMKALFFFTSDNLCSLISDSPLCPRWM